MTVTDVRFGTTSVPFTVVNATTITTTAPTGLTGAQNVFVTTSAGTSAVSAAFTYTAAGPTITSLTPNTGPTAGGTSVVIAGTNLTGVTAVNFGATAATGLTGNTATQITVTSPAGTGAASVTVTTPSGTSPGATFTYTVPAGPTLTGLAPNNGDPGGGTSVILTGTNFTGATAVSFGGVAATSFVVNSATQITAVSPAGTAGTVAVNVTTPNGTSGGVNFTYSAAGPEAIALHTGNTIPVGSFPPNAPEGSLWFQPNLTSLNVMIDNPGMGYTQWQQV